MKRTLLATAISIYCFCFATCTSPAPSGETRPAEMPEPVKLTAEVAAHIFTLPVHCLEVEYPNKLGQVLASDSDLKSPKQLRPVFYGCFDWHSSVHGYWSIVELMQTYPMLDQAQKVRALLNRHITAENVAVELAFFNEEHNKTFERTYGWAWLFKLQESLSRWKDPDAQRWRDHLQPLADVLVERYMDYLPKLVYPIRTGQHDNSAFGLSLSLDYARSVGNKDFEETILVHAQRLFAEDQGCPLSYEPSGYDFLSPCLEEAYLMSKVLDQRSFGKWLEGFLPSVFDASFELEPAVVKDRSDGKLVHLDGLNYSRAACLYGLAKALPELAHLRRLANQHIAFSLPNLSAEDDYTGSHWLGTFALYALGHSD